MEIEINGARFEALAGDVIGNARKFCCARVLNTLYAAHANGMIKRNGGRAAAIVQKSYLETVTSHISSPRSPAFPFHFASLFWNCTPCLRRVSVPVFNQFRRAASAFQGVPSFVQGRD